MYLTIFKLLRIPLDLITTVLSFILAYAIRQVTDLIPFINLKIDLYTFPSPGDYLMLSLIYASTLVLTLSLNQSYSLKRTPTREKEIFEVIIGSIFWAFILLIFFFSQKTFPFSRLALIYAWIFTSLFLILNRLILRILNDYFIRRKKITKKIAIIGKNKVTNQIIEQISSRKFHKITELPSEISAIENAIKTHRFNQLILTTHHPKTIEILNLCREHHLEFSFIPEILEIEQKNLEIDKIGSLPLIRLKPTPMDGWGKVLKRLCDIAGSIVGIIIFCPIMLIAAIAIKLNDRKSNVLYKFLDNGERVKRVGKRGKLFNFLKFRTMIPNSHNLRYTDLAHKNTRGEFGKTSPIVKIKNDPRITKPGHFLRRTSIDELPQFFNVLRGDMSLVGPRPHLPEEVNKYKKHHKFLLTIKPGITGLAAISGRSDLDFEDEVRLETWYIENWSLWLDIKILFKTLLVFFKKHQE